MHQKSWSYVTMFDGCNCYFSFWIVFCPFYPLTCPKNKNFTKMRITPGDNIILHKCTKNHDHMLHCSWDMVCDGCNCYFSFWAIFCPFTPIVCIGGYQLPFKNTPLVLAKPPLLNLQTVQAPLYILVFLDPPPHPSPPSLKIGFFSEPQKY